jgi:predicted ATPase
MSDPRYSLQSTWTPAKRHKVYGAALLRLLITGFRTHGSSTLELQSPVTALCGVNGTGKSTVLQLAAAAYRSNRGSRYYISTFILAGPLDHRPFTDEASVEFSYAAAPGTAGTNPPRKLTVSRSGSAWSGYSRQPARHVLYLGTGFYVPHSERDEQFKAMICDDAFLRRDRAVLDSEVIKRLSAILLCTYDEACRNVMRKKYTRRSTHVLTARRSGGLEYSETNMGAGEARLYNLVTAIESAPEHSLILMEEPETALHPSAQYELGKYFVNVAIRRRLQILLTTHSEYVLLALPQKSRIYLKRENARIKAIPGIGVRQAVSMMDSLAVPSVYILVEDDVAEAIVKALLRLHDADFAKTARVLAAGDRSRIRQMMEVFSDQRMPVCAVRDGDVGPEPALNVYSLFGDEPPEREVFKSQNVRQHFADHHGVDWEAVDATNNRCDHHEWFDALETEAGCNRAELLPVAARSYVEGVPEMDRAALVEQIKASIP